MAHRAFLKASKNVSYKISELFSKKTGVKQNFRNLLVLDFEATCDGPNAVFRNQEIIEFPCVVLSTEDWEVKDAFHEYVNPRVNPELTTFCTELTGIMQEVVEGQPHFPEVFKNFNEWLEHGGFLDENSAFVTSGDWDLRVMLRNQCKLDGIEVPEHYNQWIDLKKSFSYATNHYPRGLRDMAKHLNMPFTGKLHSGINDVHNMIRFIVRLQEIHKINFALNSFIDKPGKIL